MLHLDNLRDFLERYFSETLKMMASYDLVKGFDFLTIDHWIIKILKIKES